ncbi:MAG: 50S ribosomal protein L4 [Chloroflexi bacterium]|nr:50S ribosomal protein L4 [Chloroflexota bacterium]
MQVPVYNAAGEVVEQVELSDRVFGQPRNIPLIHQAVLRQQANRRQGTHDTKTRGQIDKGNRKPYRQKGTGRARQGSTVAPHFRGGGVVFGPHPRSYRQDMPVKMRRQAIRSALSAKLADDQLRVLSELSFEAPKTKEMATLLETLGVRSVLLLLPPNSQHVVLSARNIPNVRSIPVSNVNVLDVVKYEHIVLPLSAARAVEQHLGAD